MAPHLLHQTPPFTMRCRIESRRQVLWHWPLPAGPRLLPLRQDLPWRKKHDENAKSCRGHKAPDSRSAKHSGKSGQTIEGFLILAPHCHDNETTTCWELRNYIWKLGGSRFSSHFEQPAFIVFSYLFFLSLNWPIFRPFGSSSHSATHCCLPWLAESQRSRASTPRRKGNKIFFAKGTVPGITRMYQVLMEEIVRDDTPGRVAFSKLKCLEWFVFHLSLFRLQVINTVSFALRLRVASMVAAKSLSVTDWISCPAENQRHALFRHPTAKLHQKNLPLLSYYLSYYQISQKHFSSSGISFSDLFNQPCQTNNYGM